MDNPARDVDDMESGHPLDHGPRRSRMSISENLSHEMSDFLADVAAKRSGSKQDFKTVYENDESEAPPSPKVDIVDIDAHHRTQDFPHVQYGMGSKKHHHHHHHHHKNKQRHKSPPLDQRESISGYKPPVTEDVTDGTRLKPSSKSSSAPLGPRKSSLKSSPHSLNKAKSGSKSMDSMEDDVGFYVGSDAESEDEDKVTSSAFNIDSSKHIRFDLAPKALGFNRSLGSEIQLASDRSTLEEFDENVPDADRDGITSRRFAPLGLRQRKITKKIKPMRGVNLKREMRVFDHSSHEMFVELDELHIGTDHDYVWEERARWIKYEEDVEEGSGRWGKPHVASLSFHSLLELRKCLELGVILLDLEAYDMQTIANTVVDECVTAGLLNPEQKGNVLKALMLKHKHVGDKGFNIKKNLSYLDLHLMDSKRRASDWEVLKKRNGHASQPNFNKYHKTAESETATEKNDINDDTKFNFQLEMDKLREDAKKLDDKTKSKVTFSEEIKPNKQHKHVHIEIEPDNSQDSIMNNTTDVLFSKKQNTSIPSLNKKKSLTTAESTIFKRIPTGAEATSVLVGGLDFLDKSLMVFIRLAAGSTMVNLTEVPVPVRFMFILLGPSDGTLDYYEIGRSISTLMADQEFHGMAYHAEEKRDLMDAINQFLDDSIVLPPGNLEKDTLLPIMDIARRKKQKRKERDTEPLPGKPIAVDTLKRTKKLFGGLVSDIKRRYPLYLSDIKDGLNLQCLSTFFFIYFACLAPAITFGGLMGETTDKYIGVSEMLVMVCVCGILLSLLGCQPLLIVGATGPLLVFEEGLYQICTSINVEYLPFRFWVGAWVTVLATLVVMFEGIFIIRYITRFLQEIFSALISLIFIYEVFKKLFVVFTEHPLVAHYPTPYNLPQLDLNNTNITLADNITDRSLDVNMTVVATPAPYDPNQMQPNTALLSLILTFGTFIIAYALKYLRNGKFLVRQVRRAIGDFGIPIAILVMVLIDYLIRDTYTQKLDVPDGFTPTAPYKRGWLVNPLGEKTVLPVWAYFAAIIPAMLVSILIFIETLITSMIVNKADRNLKKGPGYHADLFIVGLFASVSGILGLPLVCVATVRSITHVSALTVYSTTHAPGERAHIVEVKEQRVTAFLVHIMIGVSVLLGPVLRQVPLAVLFGVFLYMGVASISGVQLFDRMELLFMPVKHHPDIGYVRKVRTWKMHLFTFIQILALAILWAVKSTQAALSFPFFILLLIPLRIKLLTHIFNEKELDQLDCAENKQNDDEDEPDFYTQAHMPM